MEQNLSEDRISEIQQELLQKVNQESDLMQEIESLAHSIAHRLIQKKHVKEYFLDQEYIFNLSYNRSRKEITVMRTDPVKLILGMGHYRPAIFRGEWDFHYTFEENVYAVVKAALCSKAGIIQVQEEK